MGGNTAIKARCLANRDSELSTLRFLGRATISAYNSEYKEEHGVNIPIKESRDLIGLGESLLEESIRNAFSCFDYLPNAADLAEQTREQFKDMTYIDSMKLAGNTISAGLFKWMLARTIQATVDATDKVQINRIVSSIPVDSRSGRMSNRARQVDQSFVEQIEALTIKVSDDYHMRTN
jgi:hypothetical protein